MFFFYNIIFKAKFTDIFKRENETECAKNISRIYLVLIFKVGDIEKMTSAKQIIIFIWSRCMQTNANQFLEYIYYSLI